MSRRRLGRKLKSTQEPLFQWRRPESVVARRVGIVVPHAHFRARDVTANVTFLTNPVFLLVNPARDEDDNPIDVSTGDIFVRLKYYDGDDTTDSEAIDAVHHTITVHSFEEQLNVLRILGDLEV